MLPLFWVQERGCSLHPRSTQLGFLCLRRPNGTSLGERFRLSHSNGRQSNRFCLDRPHNEAQQRAIAFGRRWRWTGPWRLEALDLKLIDYFEAFLRIRRPSDLRALRESQGISLAGEGPGEEGPQQESSRGRGDVLKPEKSREKR